MRGVWIVLMTCITIGIPTSAWTASTSTAPASLTPEGHILLRNGTLIPPFPVAGRWNELAARASDRYDTRHFNYLVPNASPTLELIVAWDQWNEKPDGVFEIGLVRGFLSSFAARAGFRTEPSLTYWDRDLGGTPVKYVITRLTADRRTLWAYAYIYPRNPSLTFIAIRGTGDEQASIETYLAGSGLK